VSESFADLESLLDNAKKIVNLSKRFASRCVIAFSMCVVCLYVSECEYSALATDANTYYFTPTNTLRTHTSCAHYIHTYIRYTHTHIHYTHTHIHTRSVSSADEAQQSQEKTKFNAMLHDAGVCVFVLKNQHIYKHVLIMCMHLSYTHTHTHTHSYTHSHTHTHG
jgi:hypothetical protein